LKKRHDFICGRSAYLYHGGLEAVIKQLKYHDKKYYSRFLAKITYDELKDYIEIVNPDFLVPVPVHFLRKFKRGYNQAYEISAELSHLSGIKTLKLLKRIRYTKPQNKLKQKQRLSNLKSSISVDDRCFDTYQSIHEKQELEVIKKQKLKVMIVDDIYTTGTTMDACANAFKEFGIEDVYFITVATGN
ncbi:MAG: hypothetical protein MJ113_08235, partial [Lachnospiraceae bacterium]|nr:hypothetical protein [Lachnospiraceae bacterium]